MAGEALPLTIGRYVLHGQLASGGMAAVYLAQLVGEGGFSRTVAIKRLHPTFASDPAFVEMFLDEARLASRIRHTNVVPIVDVVAQRGEVFLVMDYVPGDALSRLWRAVAKRREPVAPRIASAIVTAALHGLQAAHEATDEAGRPLGIVHRDVSPQNILVGTDGITRVIDFGVAKASGRLHSTQGGLVKGKFAYMAPERLVGPLATTVQSDIYSMGVVLWELLTNHRLFVAEQDAQLVAKIVAGGIGAPSLHTADFARTIDASSMRSLESLDHAVLRAVARDPAARFSSAQEMSVAIERCVPPASVAEVAAFVQDTAAEGLAQRARWVWEIETRARDRVHPANLVDALGGPTTRVSPLEMPTERRGVPAPPASDSLSIPKPSAAGGSHRWAVAAALGAGAATIAIAAFGIFFARRQWILRAGNATTATTTTSAPSASEATSAPPVPASPAADAPAAEADVPAAASDDPAVASAPTAAPSLAVASAPASLKRAGPASIASPHTPARSLRRPGVGSSGTGPLSSAAPVCTVSSSFDTLGNPHFVKECK